MERLLSFRQAHGILILCYHGVSPKGSYPFNGRHITSKVFEQHLRYFRKHFDLISLEDIVQRHHQGIRPVRHSLALTFDDGYQNNLQYAKPLLEKYQVPATVFSITHQFKDHSYFIWTDWIDLLGQFLEGESFSLADTTFSSTNSLGYLHYKDSYGRTPYSVLMSMASNQRDVCIRDLVDRYGLDNWIGKNDISFPKLMSAEEIQQLDASPLIDVQAHTVMHPDLSGLDPTDCFSEILRSKEDLENVLDKEIYNLAFPFGHYNQNVLNAGQSAGFRHMFALQLNQPGDLDIPRLVPRLNVSGTTTFHSQMIHLRSSFKHRSIPL